MLILVHLGPRLIQLHISTRWPERGENLLTSMLRRQFAQPRGWPSQVAIMGIGINGALGPNSKHGLTDEVTIAEICKQKGHATACFGKWHLGHHKKFCPCNMDSMIILVFYPMTCGPITLEYFIYQWKKGQKWPHLPPINGNKVINPKVSGRDQEELTTQYTERAVSFIENKDNPFLSVSHTVWSMCSICFR